ncbi:MAG TPA: ABC transporter ATP-binding protein [Hypericibacter adhaerens]|uniref:ABC transporter ATP-binding protein n=1 Tax=Hypericibacter adhaerens TaxID=2602016 RepID=UPI002CC38138|nr:ABC transporter ATP-binding protein [Hypericibacter adhaerens]HWA43935.1 ABC transporter ATP-binding protein [Hypericibacter adhaerens]
MPAISSSSRPRAGRNLFRPRGGASDEQHMDATWAEMLGPLGYIYRRYWAEAKLLLAGVALIVLCSSIAGIAAPYVFSRLIDTLRSDSWGETIVWAFVGYGVLFGLSQALGGMVNYMAMMSAENLNFIAGTAFFERLLKKTIAFFIDYNPAEIQQAKSRGQNAVYTLVQLALIVLIPGIVQITLTLLVLGASINLEIVAIVFVYGAAFIAFTFFANRWTRPWLDAAIKADQANSKFVGNSINAMETLRYFGGDQWIAGRFAEQAREVRDSWASFATRRIFYSLVFGAMLAAQIGITYFVLLPRYRSGELTIGDVVLFDSLLMQLNRPFQTIGSSIDDLLRAYSRFIPFARMWGAPEEPDVAPHPDFRLAAGTLEFEHVGFAYRDKPAVSDVSFAARRGRLNFLTGETGSGKTTLFKLALKSLEPAQGRVLVDGAPLSGIARADWYSVIGVVPQEIMLLNDTIAANIVLGRPREEARLRRAVERASIARFIDGLPEAFETRIGERGLKLSGGERQRVAIARALYADPQLLFLDEASSALDERTEAEIMGEIRNLAGEMTILAITHRKTVIAPGDAVVELTPLGVRERIAA